METPMTKGPVLIDLEEDTAPSPAEAPPVPDALPEGAAMRQAAAIAARPRSALSRWFWASLSGLVGLLVGVGLYEAVLGLFATAPILGSIALAFAAVFVVVLLALAARELAAYSRLGRLDTMRSEAERALAAEDLTAMRRVSGGLERLYRDRPETEWGRQRLKERGGEVLDAGTLLVLLEEDLLAPLDRQAVAEVEAAARQVATVTALVPLALADVVTALTANIRMIRRIAEVYGGRSGTLGSWRLTRTVFAHLVATGAVAVGDDLIGSIAGGGVLAKVSRRFGEGIINGALTARVGVAAMEVCRPLPFSQTHRPHVTGVVRRALAGLFGKRE